VYRNCSSIGTSVRALPQGEDAVATSREGLSPDGLPHHGAAFGIGGEVWMVTGCSQISLPANAWTPGSI
jgi:hypothetical protein